MKNAQNPYSPRYRESVPGRRILMFLMLFLLVFGVRAEEDAGTVQWWTQKVEEDLPRLQTPEKRVGVLGRLAILEAGRGEGGRASAFLQRLETELEAGAAPEWQLYAQEVKQTLILLAAGKQIEEWVAKGELDAARAFVANAETHPDFRAFVDSGQLDEAETALEKLESSDRIGERITLAGAHARQGRADKAREMLAGVLAEVEDMRGDADARPQTVRRHLEAILIQALELKDMPTVNRLTEADAYFRDLLLSEIFREFVFGEHVPAELAALWREMEDPAARLSFALAVAERITDEPSEDPHL